MTGLLCPKIQFGLHEYFGPAITHIRPIERPVINRETSVTMIFWNVLKPVDQYNA